MERFPKYTQVISDVFAPSVTVEAPGYIYITVRINKSIRARNAYWHLVDPAFSLLELGFEVVSSRLTSISVPLFKGPIRKTDIILPQCIQGEPLFDLEEMGFARERADIAPDVVKQPGRISLNQSGKDLDILLTESPIGYAICCHRKLTYGFDNTRRLSLIRLLDQASSLPDPLSFE